jgi:hypothetical protein
MGVTELSEIARQIEHGLADGEPVDTALDTLTERLPPLMTRIGNALPATAAVSDGVVTTAAECVGQLQTLRILLEKNDGEAPDFFARIGPGLGGVLTGDELASLSQDVGDYDFTSALAVLDRVHQRLSLELT